MFNRGGGGAYIHSVSLCQQSEVKMPSLVKEQTKNCCDCCLKTQLNPLQEKTSEPEC